MAQEQSIERKSWVFMADQMYPNHTLLNVMQSVGCRGVSREAESDKFSGKIWF